MKQYANVMPAINQLEFHPKYASPELRRVAKELGVVLIGYGTGHFVKLSKSPELSEIAKRIGRSEYDIALRWTTQSGVVVIPRSKSKEHLKSNLEINNFDLSSEDMATLDKLNENYPYYWDPVPTAQTVAK